MKKVLGLLALLLAPLASQAIEEPAYTVEREWASGVEIRVYQPYVVAEVLVPGPPDEASSAAFPILAGYIFGKNQGERRMAMTAPVTQAAEPMKMAMTAPVTQSAEGSGYRVQFVLPSDITLANAPVPDDARVQLREVPASRVAVIRYTGFWSQSNYDKHLALLQTALREANQVWVGEPVLSRYNGPMTPWFLRRNEVWLNLP